MTEQNEDRALDEGRTCAMAALMAQRDYVVSLSPQERLYWWIGFLTAGMGAAMASLGEPAARALRAAFAESREGWSGSKSHTRLKR